MPKSQKPRVLGDVSVTPALNFHFNLGTLTPTSEVIRKVAALQLPEGSVYTSGSDHVPPTTTASRRSTVQACPSPRASRATPFRNTTEVSSGVLTTGEAADSVVATAKPTTAIGTTRPAMPTVLWRPAKRAEKWAPLATNSRSETSAWADASACGEFVFLASLRASRI